jgi:hypothetical protein
LPIKLDEFNIEVDEDKSSKDICKQMVKPDSNYTLVIGEFLEIRNIVTNDSIKIDYKYIFTSNLTNLKSVKFNYYLERILENMVQQN